MFSDNYDKARIGKVSVLKHRGAYRIRFTYPKGKRHDLKIANADKAGWSIAIRAATLIDFDISNHSVDLTYARYSPIHSKRIEIATKIPDLKDIWNTYKLTAEKRVAATTKKKHWQQWERNYLGKTQINLLKLKNADKFIKFLLDKYQPTTLRPVFSNCLMPSVNLAVKTGSITKNPYLDYQISRQIKGEIEAYTIDEANLIIDRMYNSISEYYAPLLEFILITGCRSEEAIAVTWDDLKISSDKKYIRFSKAYSHGILLPHTKNRLIRVFPINDRLNSLLETQPRKGEQIFISPKGKYITWNNFRNRHYIPVVKKLVEEGKLSQYIRPYRFRATRITHLLNVGTDIASVSKLTGTSIKTIMEFYWKANVGFNLIDP